MPIYEYVCTSCSHQLEALQKISEDPLVYCPECGEDTLRKKVSAAAFHLKGTGWYVTDFKDGDKSKGDKKDAKDDAKSGDDSGKDKKEKKSESSSDSKADSKGSSSQTKSKSSGDSGKAATT